MSDKLSEAEKVLMWRLGFPERIAFVEEYGIPAPRVWNDLCVDVFLALDTGRSRESAVGALRSIVKLLQKGGGRRLTPQFDTICAQGFPVCCRENPVIEHVVCSTCLELARREGIVP